MAILQHQLPLLELAVEAATGRTGPELMTTLVLDALALADTALHQRGQGAGATMNPRGVALAPLRGRAAVTISRLRWRRCSDKEFAVSSDSSRRLGFGEKYCALLHEQKLGTATICVAVRVRRKLDFGAVRSAWETLFARQPMLRATLRTSGDDYELGFDARFADISLRFIEANSTAVWEREFSQDICARLDLPRACWRGSLVGVAVAPG